jgi:hypothetical protein
MPSLINWSLLREPYNWAAIILMTGFALLLLHTLSPETPPQN